MNIPPAFCYVEHREMSRSSFLTVQSETKNFGGKLDKSLRRRADLASFLSIFDKFTRKD